MSFSDQKDFLQSICPFGELTNTELESSIKYLEIGFYSKDSILIDINDAPQALYMIIKGEVKAFDKNNELIRVYHAKEGFDADAVLQMSSKLKYTVSEDLLCYELSKKGFMKLFESNEAFKQFYLMDIVERINYLKKRENHSDLSSFMVAKVTDSYLHEPCIVDIECSTRDALQKSVQMKSSSIVIKKGEEYGIVTDSDIKTSIADGTLSLDAPLIDMARFPIISANSNDFLFNVYLTLITKNIKRIAIMRDGELIGMLEQIDVLSYFANHSHLVTVKIEKASNIDELKIASKDYLNIIKKLKAQGVKARYIAKLVSEINRKIFIKLFEMIVPEKLRDSCTLIIMGSEGRAEQIIRTDQDNGLIIDDSMDASAYYPYMKEMTNTLLDFGYPLCDGEIMVSNPYWCKKVSEYKDEIAHWIESPDMDSYMYFSIFFDAKYIAGNPSLLEELKEYVFQHINIENDIYMARFAKLTTLFETPVGFFSTFLHRDRRINLKKAGIFPIVQGIRALSLNYKITELSTVDRIKKLSNDGLLDKNIASELIEAFEVLLHLRLGQQIEAIKTGNDANNEIETQLLSKIQRDLLKDSLQIVEQFKKHITRHFSLDNLQ